MEKAAVVSQLSPLYQSNSKAVLLFLTLDKLVGYLYRKLVIYPFIVERGVCDWRESGGTCACMLFQEVERIWEERNSLVIAHSACCNGKVFELLD